MSGLGKWLTIAVIGILIVAGGAIVTQGGGLGEGGGGQGDYEWETVTVSDFRTGDELATVDVRIADTDEKRYIGLSKTESLGADEGMLFIHDSESQYNYVMRNMGFPIDIVFIDADGRITEIHHAQADDESSFGGTGKYVLELPFEYTTANDISERDRIEIPDQYR